MIGRATSIAAAALIVLTSVQVAGQGSLAQARELYAAADYGNALTMLNGLLAVGPPPQERRSLELYRAFCLVAIGSTEEAHRAIESMVERDPLFRPNMDDVPPRLRTIFSDARKRMLPKLIQERYVIAKASFDSGDFKNAAEGFTQVLIGLSDPDIATVVKQAPLADLRVLASSFNDLTMRALSPPPVPTAPLVVPQPAPVTPAPTNRDRIVHTSETVGITQPVVIRQDVPPFPGRVRIERQGVVDVVIGPTGAVESVSLVQPIEPIYNRLLLAAAKNWFYSPARIDGVPVRFLKRIQITVSATP